MPRRQDLAQLKKFKESQKIRIIDLVKNSVMEYGELPDLDMLIHDLGKDKDDEIAATIQAALGKLKGNSHVLGSVATFSTGEVRPAITKFIYDQIGLEDVPIAQGAFEIYNTGRENHSEQPIFDYERPKGVDLDTFKGEVFKIDGVGEHEQGKLMMQALLEVVDEINKRELTGIIAGCVGDVNDRDKLKDQKLKVNFQCIAGLSDFGRLVEENGELLARVIGDVAIMGGVTASRTKIEDEHAYLAAGGDESLLLDLTDPEDAKIFGVAPGTYMQDYVLVQDAYNLKVSDKPEDKGKTVSQGARKTYEFLRALEDQQLGPYTGTITHTDKLAAKAASQDGKSYGEGIIRSVGAFPEHFADSRTYSLYINKWLPEVQKMKKAPAVTEETKNSSVSLGDFQDRCKRLMIDLKMPMKEENIRLIENIINSFDNVAKIARQTKGETIKPWCNPALSTFCWVNNFFFDPIEEAPEIDEKDQAPDEMIKKFLEKFQIIEHQALGIVGVKGEPVELLTEQIEALMVYDAQTIIQAKIPEILSPFSVTEERGRRHSNVLSYTAINTTPQKHYSAFLCNALEYAAFPSNGINLDDEASIWDHQFLTPAEKACLLTVQIALQNESEIVCAGDSFTAQDSKLKGIINTLGEGYTHEMKQLMCSFVDYKTQAMRGVETGFYEKHHSKHIEKCHISRGEAAAKTSVSAIDAGPQLPARA